MNNLINKKICVVGLGYVGLPLLEEFSKKAKVIGFDVSQSRIVEIKKKNKKLNKKSKIKLFSNIDLLPSAQVYIITVPTPINILNKPNLTSLIKASEIIGKKLNKNDVVIYESTVYPGTTEEVCIPILEKFSGLTCKFNDNNKNKNIFHVGYSPERISPGDKKKISEIVKVTSGSNKQISISIDKLYKQIIKSGTHKADSIKIAEASKIIENIQRDTNLALINQLSIIMNFLDIDINKTLTAASTKWNFHHYTPGLVGGHCIAVDPYYLIYKSKQKKAKSSIISLSRKINEAMPYEICKLLNRKLKKKNLSLKSLKVVIFGCTYKENIEDIRNSKVFDLFNNLKIFGSKVEIVDPLADVNKVKKETGIKILPIKKINNIDLIILAVPHSYFLNLKPSFLKKMYNDKKSNKFFFDLKSKMNHSKLMNIGINAWTL